MELLIAEARRMNEMHRLGQDAHSDQKKTEVAAASASTNREQNTSSADSQGMSRRVIQRKVKVEIPITREVEVATMPTTKNVHYVDKRDTR